MREIYVACVTLVSENKEVIEYAKLLF